MQSRLGIQSVVRRPSSVIILAVGAALALGGCTGATSVSPTEQPGQFPVELRMDPVTLNPPQLGTLTFRVTNNATGKVVKEFEPVAGALLHNVLIGKSLEFFRHDTAQSTVLDQASVPAFFPAQGTYYSYTLFKPAGAPVQRFKSTIVSGEAGEEAQLVEERSRSNRADSGLSIEKVTSGLSVAWIKGSAPIHAGEPSQLLFHVSERGAPVTGLWPLYDAPGHVWLVDENANELAHLMGASTANVLLPNATPGQGGTQTQGSSSQPVPRDIPGQTGMGTPMPVPTLVPPLRAALATVTAVPYPTLLPVQQIPGVGVTGDQDVRPAVGYGPDLVFSHNFPREGLYKMWLQIKWRDQIVTTDFVVRVEK